MSRSSNLFKSIQLAILLEYGNLAHSLYRAMNELQTIFKIGNGIAVIVVLFVVIVFNFYQTSQIALTRTSMNIKKSMQYISKT